MDNWDFMSNLDAKKLKTGQLIFKSNDSFAYRKSNLQKYWSSDNFKSFLQQEENNRIKDEDRISNFQD